MADAATDLAVTPPPSAAVIGAKPPPRPQGWAATVDQAFAQGQAAKAPIVADTQRRAQSDQLQVDQAAANYKPVQIDKAPPVPQTDPLQAFASFAGVFANIASAFTHAPMVNSMNAMAGAINASREGDWKKYDAEYKRWKDNTELAIQSHKLQSDDMRLAMDKMQTDLATGHAMAEAAAAQSQDTIAMTMLKQGEYDNLGRLQLERERTGAELARSAVEVQSMHEQLMERRDAMDKAKEFALALDSAKTPEEHAAALAKISDYALSRNPSEAVKIQYGQLSGNKPGSAAADNAAIEADIRKAHPDWTAGQIATEAAKQKKNVGATSYSPEALDDAAFYYLKTHQMPSTSLGGQAEKTAVANRAAEIMKAAGDDPAHWAASVAAFNAGKGSLNQLTKIVDASTAYENTAKSELDYVATLVPTLPEPLDSTALTAMVRSGAAKMGDPKAAQFQSALISALDEYAKVLSGGAASAAASTDSARMQALSLLPPGATSEQIPALIETLKKGMEFKIQNYNEQLNQIQSRLSGAPQPFASAPQTAPASSGGQGAIPDMKTPPAPARDSLVVGKKYQTKQGPATWDGTMFVLDVP